MQIKRKKQILDTNKSVASQIINKAIQIGSVSIGLASLLVSGPALAQATHQRVSQEYYDAYESNARGSNYVTIYDECGFRGRSKSLDPGEYRKMRGIGFDNDSISSVRVPAGMQLMIYEDQKFRGPYARIDRDIRCFDREWDNQVSSLKVSGEAYDQGSHQPIEQDSSYDDGPYNGSTNGSTNGPIKGNANSANQRNVTANNIARVEFDRSVLERINAKQWRLLSQLDGVAQFNETRRDGDSVYLRSKATKQRVRIDLFANDVTIISRDGRQQRYAIERKQAALVSTPRRTIPRDPIASNPIASNPIRSNPIRSNTHINGACFIYKAYTRGGQGGVRFHGKDGFFQFNKKPVTGRICHKGELTMEINKTNPATLVVIEIQGKQFRFAKNEKADKYKNTWYRKLKTLTIGS